MTSCCSWTAGRGEHARAKIVADARAAIEAQGELLRHDEWGERPLTYPIEKKTSAEYHLFQFHAGSAGAARAGSTARCASPTGSCASGSSSSSPASPTRPDMSSAAVRRSAAETAVAEPEAPSRDDAPAVEAPPADEALPRARRSPRRPPSRPSLTCRARRERSAPASLLAGERILTLTARAPRVIRSRSWAGLRT